MTSTHRISLGTLGLAVLVAAGSLSGGPAGFVPTVRAEGRNDDRHDRRHESCSALTLKGSYGFTTTGSIVAAGPVGLVADVGVLTFDGLGGVTETETFSLNGDIRRRTNPGGYFVDADCTGDISLTMPPPSGVASHFVIVDDGKELRAIVIDAGRVLTTVARRQ
jgi:hypothetical protein